MTDRERWIVYPLLFMALGFGLRNGIEMQAGQQGPHVVQSESIRCRELHVVNDDGKTVALLKANPANGAGMIEVGNGGTWQAMLTANQAGGVLTVLDNAGRSHQWPMYIQQFVPAAKSGAQANRTGDELPAASEKKEADK